MTTNALPNLAIKRLDHLGLVAGMCKELNIAEMIDTILPKDNHHHVSHGQAVVAMILNGLDFHSRTLHMFPDFFAKKPTKRLIGASVLPHHLNDDALGRTLDALFEADVSMLYQVMVESVVQKLALKSTSIHLDITSFHVDGKYEDCDENTKQVQICKDYSRDYRPDLNQIILELICENQAGIPVYMQALDGNTNDQKAFAKIAKHHIKSLKAAQKSRYFVGDAALYTAESIQELNEKAVLFISRVPMTLKEAKHLVKTTDTSALIELGNGYAGAWIDANYADVQQKMANFTKRLGNKTRATYFRKKSAQRQRK